LAYGRPSNISENAVAIPLLTGRPGPNENTIFVAMCRLTTILDLLLPLLACNDLSKVSNAGEILDRAAWRLERDFEDVEQVIQAANTAGASKLACIAL